MFPSFIPLASEKKFDVKTDSVFVVYSRGYATAKDMWLYNYSQPSLYKRVKNMIEFYNDQLGAENIDFDSTRISWSRSLVEDREHGRHISFEKVKFTTALYRPFTKQRFYFGERVIDQRYQCDKFFPSQDAENLIIAVSGIGGTKDHSVFISNSIIDLNCLDAGTQCFPLYYYEEQTTQATLFDEPSDGLQYVRKDGVSNFILKEARQCYGAAVNKEDIFYYVYGFLHSPKYRSVFADDLKKSLPRIPLVESADEFWAFSKAGRELAKLHLEYENVAPLDEVMVTGSRASLRVEKMRFLAKDRKDIIIFNPYITVENIPTKAYDYVVNGKSAIEWVMERYQIKTDKESGILNDPNMYAEEIGQRDYILNLLLSTIAVSVRTQEIVDALPKMKF
jgi:predicted helicase